LFVLIWFLFVLVIFCLFWCRQFKICLFWLFFVCFDEFCFFPLFFAFFEFFLYFILYFVCFGLFLFVLTWFLFVLRIFVCFSGFSSSSAVYSFYTLLLSTVCDVFALKNSWCWGVPSNGTNHRSVLNCFLSRTILSLAIPLAIFIWLWLAP
jgi:hypothetical protein